MQFIYLWHLLFFLPSNTFPPLVLVLILFEKVFALVYPIFFCEYQLRDPWRDNFPDQGLTQLSHKPIRLFLGILNGDCSIQEWPILKYILTILTLDPSSIPLVFPAQICDALLLSDSGILAFLWLALSFFAKSVRVVFYCLQYNPADIT